MSKTKTHLSLVVANRHGGFNTGTLCRRMSNSGHDGINCTEDAAEVTCSFCLRMIQRGLHQTKKAASHE